jgi:NADPH:quinone reductase-like Zn-dependent oxidoreductase
MFDAGPSTTIGDMKAIVYYDYGSPDVLKLAEIEKPVPADDEVLLRVRAASVNPADQHLMRGAPGVFRILFRLAKPSVTNPGRPGSDVAGTVEAVGGSVKQFKPGDEVFGGSRGSFAEYVCTPELALVIKPANLTFEQAAATPVAAYTALQGLRDKGHVQPEQKVLINGAAGGVGTFTVQIAKFLGAEVTGVCSTGNVEMVRSIGADHVIDYTQEDFTKGAQRYDLIFDLVANHSPLACRRVLNPKGSFIAAGVLGVRGTAGMLAPMLKPLVLSPFVGQKFVSFMAKRNQADLALVSQLMAAGKVTPVIDRRYKLIEVPEAMRYLETHRARGKIVIIVN